MFLRPAGVVSRRPRVHALHLSRRALGSVSWRKSMAMAARAWNVRGVHVAAIVVGFPLHLRRWSVVRIEPHRARIAPRAITLSRREPSQPSRATGSPRSMHSDARRSETSPPGASHSIGSPRIVSTSISTSRSNVGESITEPRSEASSAITRRAGMDHKGRLWLRRPSFSRYVPGAMASVSPVLTAIFGHSEDDAATRRRQ